MFGDPPFELHNTAPSSYAARASVSQHRPIITTYHQTCAHREVIEACSARIGVGHASYVVRWVCLCQEMHKNAGDGMYPGAEQAESSEARRLELASEVQAMGAEIEKLQRQAAATSSSHAATPRKARILYPVCLCVK